MTSDPVERRLRDSLYAEAMLLADEARSYFCAEERHECADLDALARVHFSCESLKVTTRVMHAVAWLLTRRALDSGELAEAQGLRPSSRLGEAPESDPSEVAALPPRARALIEASVDLHRRVARLDASSAEPGASPARAMQERLARSL